MARRKTSTGIALPWENRGTTIRRVLAGSRSRTVLAVVAIVGGVFVTYHRSEERRVARITRQTSVEVEQAVVRFREEIGRCPRSLDELLHPPRAGARYLRDLGKRYKGDLAMVAAAYNAGIGTVTRYGGIPPYAETIAYVAKVQALHARYRAAMKLPPLDPPLRAAQ